MSFARHQSAFRVDAAAVPAGRFPLASFLVFFAILLRVSTAQAALPFAVTEPANAIVATGAKLNGMLVPNGDPSSAHFEWGPTTGYGQRTAAVAVGNGYAVIPITIAISNLVLGQTYHCRLVVSNASGIVPGADCRFMTGGKIVPWGLDNFGQINIPPGVSNIIAISGSEDNCMALRNNGTIAAWGFETEGNLGFAVSLSNIVTITSGGNHNLAIKNDGGIVAWGDNNFGMTNVPPGCSNVVQVAAGDYNSYALRGDGTIVAWGRNDYGQTTVANSLSNIVAIAAGSDHAIALEADGTVFAWGENNGGATNVPATLTNVISIAAGNNHSLALKADGTVVEWGLNAYGLIDVAGGLTNITAISCGVYNDLALKSDGTVVAWGDDTYGQTNVPTPLGNVVAIAGCVYHCLSLGPDYPPVAYPHSVSGPANHDVLITLSGSDTNGDVVSYRVFTLPAHGSLYQYSLGARGAAITAANTPVNDASHRIIFAPAPDQFGATYDQFNFVVNDGELDSIPGTVSLGIKGALFANTQPPTLITTTGASLNGMVTPNGFASDAWFEWGADSHYGQSSAHVTCGTGGQVARVSAGITNLIPGGVYHFRIAASNATTTAVVNGADCQFIAGGKITPQGRDNFGQLDLPSTATNVVAVAGGQYHSLALRTDGHVVGWGWNGNGQATPPGSLTNAVAIACGLNHGLAVRSSGMVSAWGYNGDGETTVPPDLTNAIAVCGGYYHSVALRSNGLAAAWGAINVPASLSNIVALASGYFHVVALLDDGTVAAWGDNQSGQTNLPSGLTNVIAISCGSLHSLALKRDGTVAAWGSDSYGQTDVPSGLSNVVAITAGGEDGFNLAYLSDGSIVGWGFAGFSLTYPPSPLTNIVTIAAGSWHALYVAGNNAPTANTLAVTGMANSDLLITFNGSDPNTGDVLRFRITALPARGTLYQSAGGARGAAITAPGVYLDSGQAYFVPAPDDLGNPYAQFSYVANDGTADSTPALVTVRITQALYALTQPATMINTNAAALNGVAHPAGLAATAWFEWGTNSSYGQTSSPVTFGPSNRVVVLTANPAGLAPRTTYHYRFVATNSIGTVFGAEQEFITGGKLIEWGRGDLGETNVPLSLTNAVAIAASSSNSLALKTDGKIAGWGSLASGLTNIPSTATNAIAICCGSNHCLALRGNGTVIAWGFNVYGQTNVPAAATNVMAISAGVNHSVALRRDGTVLAWGINSSGVTNVPVSLSNVVAIASGYEHVLTLRSDGTISAWGKNDFQQVSVPLGTTNIVAVSAGASHSLALKSNGTVLAWGNNTAGQCNVPSGLSNVIAIAAGEFHSAALRSDGSLVVWGSNASGQRTLPADLNNVAALAAGRSQTLVIGNRSPVAGTQTVSGFPNHDLTISLSGADPDNDALNFRVLGLPAAGALYQFNAGSRGLAISSPNTVVNDSAGRVFFAPAIDGLGDPYSTFNFTANDGLADSASALVTVKIILPPPPSISNPVMGSNRVFNLSFNGNSNATYSIWSSTNLNDWMRLGVATMNSPGLFLFADPTTTNSPLRFYRVGAP